MTGFGVFWIPNTCPWCADWPSFWLRPTKLLCPGPASGPRDADAGSAGGPRPAVEVLPQARDLSQPLGWEGQTLTHWPLPAGPRQGLRGQTSAFPLAPLTGLRALAQNIRRHRVGAGPACSRASGPQSLTLLPSQSPESQEASPGHLPGRTLRPPLQPQKWTLSPNSKTGAPQKLDSQAPSHPMTAQKGGGSHHPEGTWQQRWWEGCLPSPQGAPLPTLNFSLHFLLSMPPAGRPPTRAQGLSRQET